MAETVEHTNFYENINEVRIRLVNTVIKYDDTPYYVLTASDHKKDGIIRLYLDDLTDERGPAHLRVQVPYQEYSENGPQMDAWLESKEAKGEAVIRKVMNSPHFNKFRPFPLGMCNYKGKVVYIERSPTRNTYQGLIQQSMIFNYVTLSDGQSHQGKFGGIPWLSKEVADCIQGLYPTADDTIAALLHPRIQNEGAAFHREFAFIRGPMQTLYLAYKDALIGILPNADTTVVKLAPQFRHCREAVQQLRLFQTVEV